MNPLYKPLFLSFTIIIIAIGCDNQRDTERSGDSDPNGNYAPQEVCDAVDDLGASLDALEDSESLAEYRAAYSKVRQDSQKLREAGGSKYAVECDAFDKALNEFGESLNSFGDGGVISGLLSLAGDAAELAAAGELLDEAIDCPGI